MGILIVPGCDMNRINMEIDLSEDELPSLAWGEERNAFAMPLGTRKKLLRGQSYLQNLELPVHSATSACLRILLPAGS